MNSCPWLNIIKAMSRIRQFEFVIQSLYHLDYVQSPVHLSVGQELLSVLISICMTPNDKIIGNYRSHAISVALSDTLEPLILELLAKSNGISGGKAGSMHLSVPDKGLMWTSAIVGSGVPISCGVADALKRTTLDGVCFVMFGDGALEEGCVLESLNLASSLSLPVVFVLEDNGLAINTKKDKRSKVHDYLELARSFSLKVWDTSYRDPRNILSSLESAVAFSRTSRDPTFIRVECYRWLEHVGINNDWSLGYRNEAELQQWVDCDLIEHPEICGVDKSLIDAHSSQCHKEIFDMFIDCLNDIDPDQSDLLKNVH